MGDNKEIKGLIAAVTGVMSYLYNSISELLVILVMFMIFDYVTGVFVAFKKGCFHPSDGAWGAVKKAFYGIVVASGFLADYIINFIAKNVQIPFNSPGLLGIAVTLYLIANEGLSVFRNLICVGVPVPDFIIKYFGYIKDEAGQIVKVPNPKCKPKRGKKDVCS